MELDDSDSEDGHGPEAEGPPPPPGPTKSKGLGADTLDCFQSLSKDLLSVQEVLDQVFKLASGPRRSKDLALVGLQDEISNASAKLRRLRTGLEVGRVSQTVQVLKQTKKATKQDDKKPLSYVEAAKHGVSTRTPTAPRAAVAWSATRTVFSQTGRRIWPLQGDTSVGVWCATTTEVWTNPGGRRPTLVASTSNCPW